MIKPGIYIRDFDESTLKYMGPLGYLGFRILVLDDKNYRTAQMFGSDRVTYSTDGNYIHVDIFPCDTLADLSGWRRYDRVNVVQIWDGYDGCDRIILNEEPDESHTEDSN